MAYFPQFDSSKQPRSKVELHVHLDGAIRVTTIWEISKKKGCDLKAKTLQQLYDVCSIKKPSTLANYLKPINLCSPIYVGDAEVIERIAYEFCEDAAQQGIHYVEVRYSPHLFASKQNWGLEIDGSAHSLSPTEVVKSVNKGLERGSKEFQVKVRSILCCIRGHPEWSHEVLELCVNFRNEGVIGIDIAGDEASIFCSPTDVQVFQKAASLNIQRTAHAGEAGPADNVLSAINDLRVTRIGHGYNVLKDRNVYKECLDRGIHFELCPYSSLLTGAVPLGTPKHPIVRLVEDNANFSINRDDPMINNKTLVEDYELLRVLGLSDAHFAKANFNAARSSFLPEEEKKELIKEIMSIYGACATPPKYFSN